MAKGTFFRENVNATDNKPATGYQLVYIITMADPEWTHFC
jgi:hypothetical protein